MKKLTDFKNFNKLETEISMVSEQLDLAISFLQTKVESKKALPVEKKNKFGKLRNKKFNKGFSVSALRESLEQQQK